jgi:hypothetical protein
MHTVKERIGICEKIREEMESPFNPFDAFMKDVFG